MGTDTDHVYPPIIPVKGDLTARQRLSKMQNSQVAEEREDCGVPVERSQIADERDDCGVPWIRTYLPERARMGTDTDNVYPAIGPVNGGST